MAGRIASLLDAWHQRRAEERWTGLADQAGEMSGSDLRAIRTEARGLRRKLDRVLQSADLRLGTPALGTGLPQMSPGTDWAWRPDPWRGRMPDPGCVAGAERTAIAENLALYHDCPLGEIAVRQVRNQTEADRAPYGLMLDVLGFRGSFLSLALNLPDAGVAGLKSRHLVRVEAVIDSDRPIRGFVRLNIKHGPNLSQPVSTLSSDGREKVAEFDLAYADLNDARIERAWVDLILNDAEMTSVHLRDVVLSRRPRAEL
jgi:hypothetical protein